MRPPRQITKPTKSSAPTSAAPPVKPADWMTPELEAEGKAKSEKIVQGFLEALNSPEK